MEVDDDMPGAAESWDGTVVPLYDEPPAWMDDASDAIHAQEDSAREPLPLIDPSEWGDEDPPERRWLVDGMVPHGQATLLTGAGSAGKSLVQQLQCTCVALGLPWLGIETEQANAIYVSCEDDTNEMWRRQKAICAGLGVTLADLKGKLWLLSLVGMIDNELATFDERGRTHVAGRYRDIQDACSRVEARFVALDNTGHFFSGNENDRHQVASFIGLGNALAAHIDGSVVIIGHPNKAGAQYSGSTAWENQVRSRLFMEIPTDEDGNAADPDVRVITRGKSNYAQKGGELRFRWYQWTFVLDDAVPEEGRVSIAKVAQANLENEAFLRCLAKASSVKRAVSHINGINYAPRIFASMPEARGVREDGFKRAMEGLISLGKIELDASLWKGPNRHWKTGIKETENSALTPAPTPCANPRQPQNQVIENIAPALRAPTPPYTTYMDEPALGEPGSSSVLPDPPSWMDEVPHDDEADADAWMRNPLLNPDFGKDA
jgi:RecA-family ATPase